MRTREALRWREGLPRLWRAPCGADINPRGPLLHAAAPRREDSCVPERAPGRAQAGHLPSSPTGSLEWTSRSGSSIPRNGTALLDSPLPEYPCRPSRSPIQGPSHSTPVTASWRSSGAPIATRTTPSSPVGRPGCLARELAGSPTTCAGRGVRPRVRGVRMGAELRRGRRGAHRRRPAHGYTAHGPRPSARRPGAAAGTTKAASRDRADRAPRAGFFDFLARGEHTLKGERSRARLRAARSGPDPEFASRAPGTWLPLSSPRARSSPCSRGPLRRLMPVGLPSSCYRGAGRGKEPPLSTSSSSAPRPGASICPSRPPTTHAFLST